MLDYILNKPTIPTTFCSKVETTQAEANTVNHNDMFIAICGSGPHAGKKVSINQIQFPS